jgi:hemolysin III
VHYRAVVMVEPAVEIRPTWRGRMHTWWFALAVPAGALLILASEQASARVAASIYAATLLLVFGTSASYHRLARSPRSRRVMQRLDHSMIYLLIAGTYTPMCLVALPYSWGIPILASIGACAVVGWSFGSYRGEPRSLGGRDHANLPA